MKLFRVLAVVMAATFVMPAGTAFAGKIIYPKPPVKVFKGGGGSSFPWVVGAVFCIAGGTILKAVQFNYLYNRELTREEALLAGATCGLLPFGGGYAQPAVVQSRG